MAYTKTNWTTSTPINPTNLKHIENGIANSLTTEDIKTTQTNSDTATYSCNYLNKNILTAKMETNFNFITNQYTMVNNWVLDKIVGDKLSIENGRVKVGDGVSKVKISYFSGISIDEADVFYAYPKINDTSILPWVTNYLPGASVFSISWESFANVNSGDLISLAVYTSKTGKLEAQRNLMIVEVIE